MACVSDNEVAALVEGLVSPVRRAELLGEIASCSSCRALLHDCLVASSGGERAPLELPAEIAGYRLGDVLGAGSGGIVVRARDRVLDRDVALKLVRTAGDGDPAAHALREARTLATLRHPAVVQVYATGATGNLGYVAMELVDGMSLAAQLARGPLPWRDAVALFADVAAGLAAIHAAGLVHRDLKPGNLLLDGDRLRIADFGLAARDPGAALAGTLPYLAPELLAGGAADARSDLYALFAALFEALTGERPYRETDRRALRAAAEHGRPSWPRRVPVRVRRVVERGLAPNPVDRFADATAARAALRSLSRASPWWFRAAVGAAAVGAVAVIVGVTLHGGNARRVGPVGSPAEQRAITDARAALGLHDTARAIDQIASIAADSPAAGDAELIRGLAALDLENDVAAVAAFRRVAELAATAHREDLAIAADQGLAFAIGVEEHETAAGEAYATAALTAATKLGDARAAGVARRTIGWLAYLGGDTGRANTELAGAADALRAANAPLEVAIAELQLGKIARVKGDYAAASAHVERAFALRRDALGADHPDTLAIDLDRATIAAADGHAAHAVELMRGEIARLEALYGPTNRSLAAPLTSLASALAAHGDFQGADAAITRGLAIDRAAHGELDRSVAKDYANLAGIRVVEGKFDEAAELYRAAIASGRSALGDDHPDLAPIYAGLGVALASAQHDADAADALAHAIAIWRARPGHDDELAHALAKRSLIELGLQRTDDARHDAEDSLAMLTRVHGERHVALAPALSALGQAELAAGHLDAARSAMERAIAIHQQAGGAPRQTVEERVVLAHVLWQQDHHDDALALGRQALADLNAPDSALGKQLAAWLRAPS